jgi:hypothetical protein
VIPGATLERPGRYWNLADCWRKYLDLVRPFTAAGLPAGTSHFPGTIFRLPFRTIVQAKRSEIANKPFTAANLVELIRELGAVREELLLFLKRVEEIGLTEVTTAGEVRPLLTIATDNPDEVRAPRSRLLSALTGGPVEVAKRLAGRSAYCESYQHRFVTRRPITGDEGNAAEEETSAWRVVAGLAVDAGGNIPSAVEELADRGMKVVPLAGAAACLKSNGALPTAQLTGKVYCGLPLPAVCGFPVHLNGFFDLDSSRQALTTNVTGNSRIRSRWNELLVAHVLAPAYARLIQDVASDIGEENPEAYYALWPLPTGTPPKPLDSLSGPALRVLAGLPVVRASSGPRWVAIEKVRILPRGSEELTDPLVAAGWVLPSPQVPARLVDALVGGGTPVNRMTPSVLRGWFSKFAKFIQPLATAPNLCLRRLEWVEALLRFCLSDKPADLSGLPLAVTAGGHLRSFGLGPAGEPLYVAGPDEQRLFEGQKTWFLDSVFAARCGIVVGRVRGVSGMTPAEVLARLPDLFPQPESARLAKAPGFPTAAWLRGVRVLRPRWSDRGATEQ